MDASDFQSERGAVGAKKEETMNRMLDTLSGDDIKRLKSWLKEACNTTDTDFFKKMIFCWIAFNIYYGAKYKSNTGTKHNQHESPKIRHVLSQTLTESKARRLLNECSSNINLILDNTTNAYYMLYKKKYRNAHQEGRCRDAWIELIILVEKIRNRVFHGGKSYDNPEYGNRDALLSCSTIILSTLKALEEVEQLEERA